MKWEPFSGSESISQRLWEGWIPHPTGRMLVETAFRPPMSQMGLDKTKLQEKKVSPLFSTMFTSIFPCSSAG